MSSSFFILFLPSIDIPISLVHLIQYFQLRVSSINLNKSTLLNPLSASIVTSNLYGVNILCKNVRPSFTCIKYLLPSSLYLNNLNQIGIALFPNFNEN